MRIWIAAMLMMAPGAAYASWDTAIDDDIFSGGKKAFMLGEINRRAALVVDCTSSGELSVSYVEKGSEEDIDVDASYRLLVKVGEQPVVEMAATAQRRGDEFNAIVGDDRPLALQLVRQIRSAKGKLLVGVRIPDTDMKISNSLSLAGSSRATAQLMKACGLE